MSAPDGGSGTGGAGSLFGNTSSANNNTTQAKSLFGNAPVSSGPSTAPASLFGTGPGGNSSNPFSGKSQGGSSAGLFGSTSQSTSASPFGNTSGNMSRGFSLGGTSTNDNSKPSTPNLFGSLATPNKQTDSGPPSQSGTLFGQTGSSTPANKGFFTNNASTTPAGPPPASASANLFGGNMNQKPGTPFGSAGQTGESSGTTQAPSGNLFGSNARNKSGTLFPNSAPLPSGPNIFSSPNTDNNNASNQAATSGAGGSSTTPKPLFPQNGSAPSASQAASATTAGPASTSTGTPSLFGSQSGTPAATASTQQSASLFAGIGKSATEPNTQAPTPNSFTNASSGQANALTSTVETSKHEQSTSQPTATTTSTPSLFGGTKSAPASAPSGFGNANNSTAAGDTTQTTTSGPAAGSGVNTTGGFGNSTTGQAPSAQSRLKNKSMDDIITRWASDLTKYQKEFQQQADKIASWDRQLVENSNVINKLYSKTYQAERDTAEIQKQLTTVEQHQDELTAWLDRYEQEVDDLMERQVNQQDGLQGPDQERERAYRTAETVSERLRGMGQDLTSMIEEINTASSAISKTNKADDPLSQIVRVLNGHLSQLQLIDQGTAELQAKVNAAQKESQRLGSRGRNGHRYDAAEEFARSFRSKG